MGTIPSRTVARLGAAAALIFSIAACDAGKQGVIAPPTAPTTVPPAASPPSAPAPPAEPPPPRMTVTGRVLEFTGSVHRPVPNLRLKVRVASRSAGAVGGVELPDVVTDSNGRYQVSISNPPLLFIATAPESDYRLPCDWFPVFVHPDGPPPLPRLSELYVVHVSRSGDPVSWFGDPSPTGMYGTNVYGFVSERVNGALRPLMDATVMLDSGGQDPPATTSAIGFYMICSVVGTDQYRTITARKDGYNAAAREIFGGWESRVDLELTRD